MVLYHLSRRPYVMCRRKATELVRVEEVEEVEEEGVVVVVAVEVVNNPLAAVQQERIGRAVCANVKAPNKLTASSFTNEINIERRAL